MNKYFILLIIILLLPLSLAQENLYQQDSLELELTITGKLNINPTGSGARVKKYSAELLLYPQESYRQKLLTIENSGQFNGDTVLYEWTDGKLGEKEFGYTARIKTQNSRLKVTRKVTFPLPSESISQVQEYIQPTEKINSDHPAVIAQATSLVQGEDDMFKVVFNLADWVEKSVSYDLNTLTAQASQSASWVLENRQGVCDEMTSLFIAMARSVGIPARFVKGISYTTSDLFSESWQPHGWAEVYFPDIGWVGFDITFGEFGYVDVTHIKLRDGFDPTDADSKYAWTGNKVHLETDKLDFNVKILNTGNKVPNLVSLQQSMLAEKVGFGSYNIVKGVITNEANNYAAITLQAAVPEEVALSNRNRRTILLLPSEVRETYWTLRVRNNLDPRYTYVFPVALYSEQNDSSETTFSAQEGQTTFSKEEIQKLIIEDEEKSYSRQISLNCQGPLKIKQNSAAEFICELKNTGNTNLQNIQFCVHSQCKTTDLPVNQQTNNAVTITATNLGQQKIIVTAKNSLVEKTKSVEYTVFDDPSITISAGSPPLVNFGEDFELTVNLMKSSFSSPEKIVVLLEGPSFENKWQIIQLDQDQKLVLDVVNYPLAYKNKFIITTTWQDSSGKTYSDVKNMIVTAKANSFTEKIKLFVNGIMQKLS
jgi:hypothetical protein